MELPEIRRRLVAARALVQAGDLRRAREILRSVVSPHRPQRGGEFVLSLALAPILVA